jgi:hypothetical protein
MDRNDKLLGIIYSELSAAVHGDREALANLSRAATALKVVGDPTRDVAEFVRLSDSLHDGPYPERYEAPAEFLLGFRKDQQASREEKQDD